MSKPKALIIHHKLAWTQTISKYGIDTDDVTEPSQFPVLLAFELFGDEEDPSAERCQVITMEQAAKFISIIPIATLAKNVNPKILQVMNDNWKILQKGNITKPTLEAGKGVLIAQADDGTSVTISSLVNTSVYQIGDKVMINNQAYTIIGVGNDPNMTEAGSSGIAGAEEMDMESEAQVSELEQQLSGGMPIDPAKLKKGQSGIADETEEDHVLDVERAV